MKECCCNKLPKTQQAVQLVGPDKLVLNKSKEVFCPGSHQVLCRIEAVGLCFSDLKLLKQFSGHVRKSGIVAGIEPEVLKQIPSYVPGDSPAVPGHETVVRIEAVGPNVENIKVGQRYLVQTDYRWLATANSNAAFGYNFEGALQEYVLMDQRVITSPQGDSMLIPVSEKLSASAVALVEPWACVEDAYACNERQSLKVGGRLLILADMELTKGVFQDFFRQFGMPGQIIWISKYSPPADLNGAIQKVSSLAEVKDDSCDDVIYFGSDTETVEKLFAKIAPHGLFNIVLCGGTFAKDVNTPVGRVHYGGIRIIGTVGENPSESMGYIPETGEIRPGDKINVIGAAGPMGLMHVVRNICQGIEGISVYAGDVDDGRLDALSKVVDPLARKNKVVYKPYNSTNTKIEDAFNYTVLMAPIPALVVAATLAAAERGIVNIFAGIPATVYAYINLNEYIKKQLYYIGTSGSTIEDMKVVLNKVETGKLDTNVSVAAVSGLDGAVDGIRAVENRSIAGKIIVYPFCKGMGLIPLKQLSEKMPEAAKKLKNGLWTKQAENRLLEYYKQL
jgi:L-sorbose 1-phosphate reductase